MKFLLKLDCDKLEKPLPTSGQIAVIVMENNSGMRFVPAREGALVAVECDNQPRKIEGLKWERVEE